MNLLSIILLGLVQGVTEWVPVSSKTQVTFVYLSFLHGNLDLVIPILIWVHLGTVIAATFYFRKEINGILREIKSKPFNYETYTTGRIGFLFAALLFTGIVGLPILFVEKKVLPSLDGTLLYILMGLGLIFTGILLLSQKKRSFRRQESVGLVDGVVTGLLQGLSSLPGVSRSGTTSTALIWRSFDAESAFNLSFLLSIPSVILADVIVYFGSATGNLSLTDGLALATTSLIFGYITLDVVLKLVKKVNIAYLVLALGVLAITAALFHGG